MKAVVVAGGEPDPHDAAHLADADLIVAADGGAAWLERQGVRPHALVGDMDSIEADLLDRLTAAGVEIEHHPTDKEASDAELALDRAEAAGADQVILLGALGGERLDHELANVLALAEDRGSRCRELRAVRGGTVIRALHGGGRVELGGRIGDWVSLLPIGGDAEGVRTDGLRYPLDGGRLSFGRSRGLSNVITHRPASVSLERGTLLLVEHAIEGDG